MEIDLRHMFPEAYRRYEVLEGLKRYWSAIVGLDVARYSQPYNLGILELFVFVKSDKAKAKLLRMQGNITRQMIKRWGYKTVEGFSLNITESVPVRKVLMKRKEREKLGSRVVVSEERVKELMKRGPESLPEDINYSLSHLQAFMEQLPKG